MERVIGREREREKEVFLIDFLSVSIMCIVKRKEKFINIILLFSNRIEERVIIIYKIYTICIVPIIILYDCRGNDKIYVNRTYLSYNKDLITIKCIVLRRYSE